jgi:phospholipid/cholesterol/gamma-HCH transport system ATP-binding protein
MIKLIDLTRSFNGHKVLDEINLDVPQGKISVIIGKSGTGKSVLLKHIVGLMKPDRGKILIGGVDIVQAKGRLLKELKERFAILFQGGALFDSMTVLENVAFPLREKTKLPDEEIVKRARQRLKQVALTLEVENKFPDELSGGMKKRVALARALIQEPEIILFDEPVTGLDPPMTNAVFQLITKTHQESGYTGLIVSHDIPEIFSLADHVAMLHEGRIIAYGTPTEIQQSTNPVVQNFIQGKPDFLKD